MFLLKKRIFIIEDNIVNRAIAQLLLEQQGAKTAIDRWGIDTVTRLHNFMPVDIILMDLMFPNGITGYDIFDQIRSYPEFDHIPIVAVSASDPAEAIQRTKAHGFDGFISKPLSPTSFARQIADMITQKQY